jgi:hypothetical protein
MLDMKRHEFVALVGGGGLLLAVKVKRARGQQSALPVIGFSTPRRLISTQTGSRLTASPCKYMSAS